MSFHHRHVLLGVTAGIAAYKSCGLVRRLREAGADVRVVMTENATRFIGTATFQGLTGQPVHTSVWETGAGSATGMDHIDLARWADLVIIAPATADAIARLAHGRCDDLLTTICLATEAPLAVAPAMNHHMWLHPATQDNINLLKERGARILGPGDGPLAEGESGPGRLLEPDAIVAALALPTSDALAGLSVLVSAGPTYEDIDPVRFLGNRSSGRMGFAVAAAAVAAGADVTLVAGPVALPTPAGVTRRIDVRSARQMQSAVLTTAQSADIFIAAAAVGDYRPATPSDHKIKKQGDHADFALDLVENPDILRQVTASPRAPFVVGFAAETRDLEAYAMDKLERKHLDMIAANLVGHDIGFDCPENALTIFWKGGHKTLPKTDKATLGQLLVECIADRHATLGKDPA